MLERYAMKVARTVLRGGSGSNATPLPDHADPGKHRRGRRAGFSPSNWLFSWIWVLSVSGASLVPPAAGIPLRYASGTMSRAVGTLNAKGCPFENTKLGLVIHTA